MEVFQVGGSVRDELLGMQSKDRDWVVVNSSPEEMEKNGFKPIGKDFPVFLHPETNEEYALARTEKKSGVGYKGFKFYFDSSITLEEDLKRRDFTINSIAKDQNGKIIDPYNGKFDLENKIFRHTSSAFPEDPLRVLRFARFKSYEQLNNFKLHKETKILFQEIIHSKELKDLSPDRVWMETRKALVNKYSEEFFNTIITFNLTNPWFKKLKNVSCDGSVPESKWADMQRVNDFQLSGLPIPNSFQKTQDLLKQILDLIKLKKIEDKVELVKKMNIHRNYQVFEDIKKYKCLKEHKNYLEIIFNTVLKIDFSSLDRIQSSEILHKKQLLYYDALKEIV
tara:strand:+ start:7688 stop:8701 length:1014 start_codon:yes stop_codon:yes gene_type:complete